ncbi:MAG: hypothetical protein JRG97_10195 [Deltaproteobacteria bacterium]|nr:hypothetical protein [Deltaproteobacteria bacterium]
MRKALFAVAIIMGLCLAPILAIGGEVQGTVQGFTCVTQGKVCPVGAEDPMAAVENGRGKCVRDSDRYAEILLCTQHRACSYGQAH